jgi:hypothetical protein
MGLLTPLYLAGLAALSLPLVLHLIRRTPRGRQAFSSLMFLSPSPPRLTRRSRLDHLLLLTLRLLALGLLALAFARPFLRESALLPLDNLPTRRVAILLDTSASMRRGDLWTQAVSKVADVLANLGPSDDVALYRFDDRLQTIVDFEDANSPAAGKPDLVRQRLQKLTPTWGATDLASALIAVAGDLEVAADVNQAASEIQLVLITDLARGSRSDALQAYRWPQKVPVVAHVLSPEQPTNAAARLLTDDEQAPASEPRLRVTNAANSSNEQFFVGWAQSATEATQEPIATYVPAGQSRVVRLPRPAGEKSSDRIVLRGDDADFDNTYYVVPPRPQEVQVAWLGDEAAEDSTTLRYYFGLAVADDPLRNVLVQTAEATSLAAAGPQAIVVATKTIDGQAAKVLEKYVAAGGTMLIVLNDRFDIAPLGNLLEDVEAVDTTSEPPDVAGKPNARTYRMLGEIDFTHPLFVPFANPHYSDFTKIRFWRHRALRLKDTADTRMVARFDNGDPAILDRAVGAGRVLVLTSGWQPEESQLALSSKFVPLIQTMLDQACGGAAATANWTIGQAVSLPPRAASRTISVEKPDGIQAALPADAQAYSGADQPGIYRFHVGDEEYPFAVNIAAAESDTSPMTLERLEKLGVRLDSPLTRAQRAEQMRQQRDTELESHQQLWRWLIVAAMMLLIVETWLANAPCLTDLRRILQIAFSPFH